MLFLAADHGGFEQKELTKKFLESKNIEYKDMGPDHFDPEDDYPDLAYPAVARMNPATDRAILFCRSGEGMAILANKMKGIRAVVVWNADVAKKSREHDDANVLAIPSDYVADDALTQIVDTWLATPFSAEARHKRRLGKISDLENKLFPDSKMYNE